MCDEVIQKFGWGTWTRTKNKRILGTQEHLSVFASETGGFPQFPCSECTASYRGVLANSGPSPEFLVSF